MVTSKKVIGIFSIATIVAIGALVLTTGVVSAADILFVGPGENYTSIQSALNVSNPFDTIIVRDGIYTENIDVDVDNVTIRSENGSASCFVNALDQNDSVFYIITDWVNISGFTVQNATDWGNAGIYLTNADHCIISENTALNNYRGIYLYSSCNNTLVGNTASNNQCGIELITSSNNNTLIGNTIKSNNGEGIWLYSSSNNILTDNIVSNNPDGVYLRFASNNILTGNTASNGYGGIYLYKSSNNIFMNNTASDNNYFGICLYSSSNNHLSGNTASNNSEFGIRLYSSSNNNTIYNNYFDNAINADDDGTNIWNISKTSGTNIIGGSWVGGNYWSDYTGEDTNGDGLGDTQLPYNSSGDIVNGGDRLPLVKAEEPIFDTGEGSYPSISGTFTGTITPSRNITVSTLYTYSCKGTGGHTKSIELYEDSTLVAGGVWSGYQDDWHNITFNPVVTLLKGHEYRYVIVTGSYPQIIHESPYYATGGVITCTEFVDINVKRHEGWIPAIRLY